MEKFEWKVEKDVFYFNYLEMASTVEEAQEQANFVRSQLAKPESRNF